jgi:hypothetical protein
MPNPLTAGVLVVAAVTAAADERPADLLLDTRETVTLDGSPVGFLRTTVRPIGGEGRLRAATELDLNFRCYGNAVRVRREYGDEESSDGRVFSVFMKQLQDQGRQLTLTGTVEGDRLHVRVEPGRIERRLRWSDDVVGLAAQERLLAERRPKPGERFSFLRYEPTFNTVVTVRVTVKDPEAVGNAGPKLLRVEFQPDRIEVPGTSVQPPGSVVWLDERLTPVRREVELDGVGKAVLVRVAKDGGAAAPPNPGDADVGLRTLVPLDRRIARPHATRSAVYRITLRGEPAGAFARDGHQEIRNVRGDTFELVVHPVQPVPGAAAGPAADEYRLANYFIDSHDARVRDLARRAVGGETDPWTKAVLIERWVHRSMCPASGAALVPASEVARELRGDCRAYALLTAALCRAEGIPSRTAIGLVYVERGTAAPKLGFHMWTEVCLGGRWVGLDGTLGQGGVGACHVKISDSSWYGTRSQTPLLPANRVLGKISVEVVGVDGGA